MKACYNTWCLGNGGCHASPEPATQGNDKHHPSGENALFKKQKQTNGQTFLALSSSVSVNNSTEGGGHGVKRGFLDPAAVTFMVGHYNNKVFFLIKMKSFDFKGCSLVSILDSWRSWGKSI